MIRASNLSFSYDGKNKIFENVSFHIKKGEIMAVLGANGIGKTTLMRCTMRFLTPSSGSVFIDGMDEKKLSQQQFWEKISYVPQAKSLIFGYSVLDMTVMGRSQFVKFGFTPGKADYDKAYSLLEEMGLLDCAHRSCNSLSGGQLQMVLIARALMKDPAILIMDEPESNLDMRNQLKVLDIMEAAALGRGVTVIINTHYPEHALRYANKTLILGKDTYIFGKTKETVTAQTIEDFFGVEAKIYNVRSNGTIYQGILPISYKNDAVIPEVS